MLIDKKIHTNSVWFYLKALIIIALLGLSHAVARAEDIPPHQLTIKEHKFIPATLHVPANKDLQILVENKDPTAEEFDSTALGVEKVIVGEGRGILRLHPLKPGRYAFAGEYHADTAQGILVAE